MNEFLLLLLGVSPHEPLRWGLFDEGRLIEGGGAEDAAALADIGEKAKEAARVIALLPGEQVAVRLLASAPKGAAKAQAAARFLLEDELGESADSLHVILSQADGYNRALAVKNSVIDDWLEALGAAGIEPDSLSADFLTLASSNEVATLVCEPQRIVAAFDGAGFGLESDLFAELGVGVFSETPLRIDVLGEEGVARFLPPDAAINRLGPADDARLLTFYGERASTAPGNLLQGRYARRRKNSTDFAIWRRAGAMAAALLVVAGLSIAVDAMRAGRLAARWEGLAQQVHAAAFPDDAAEDPAAHARRILNEGGGAQFLALSTRFADALGDNEAVRIDRLRYNASRGEYIVSIESASDAAIETFRADLEDRGVAAVDNGGYRRSGGLWTGELTARTP